MIPVSLAVQIEEYAATLPEGTPIRATALRTLGARAAVDQALARLAREHRLVRIGRGLYVTPITTRFGVQTPYAARVVEQLSRISGEVIVPNGAVSANALRLSQQVPMQLGFLTSGPTRTLRIGPETVVLRNAKSWELAAPGSIVGEVVRALVWIGEPGVEVALEQLKARLTPEERQQVCLVSAAGPAWLSMAITRAFAVA